MHFDHMHPPPVSLNPPRPAPFTLISILPPSSFFIFIPHLVQFVLDVHRWPHLWMGSSTGACFICQKPHPTEIWQSLPISHQLAVPSLSLQWGPLSPSTLHAGMLTGLVLYRSYGNSHTSCQIMVLVLLYPEDKKFCPSLPWPLALIIFSLLLL